MKKTIKVMAAIMLVAAMVLGIAACGGLDMSKVKGDWTVSTINGQSVADFAAANNLPQSSLMKNYTITDKEFIFKSLAADGSSVAESKMDISVKSNGFEVMNDGKVFMSVTYKDDTLSYSINQDGTTYEYVLKKGTTDIMAQYQADNGGAAQAEEGAAQAEEGAEEGGSEEGADAGEEGAEE